MVCICYIMSYFKNYSICLIIWEIWAWDDPLLNHLKSANLFNENDLLIVSDKNLWLNWASLGIGNAKQLAWINRIVTPAEKIALPNSSVDYIVVKDVFWYRYLARWQDVTSFSVQLFTELNRILKSNWEICIIETLTPNVSRRFLQINEELVGTFFTYSKTSSILSKDLLLWIESIYERFICDSWDEYKKQTEVYSLKKL